MTADAPALFEHLNPAQAEAVRHAEGPLLVIAGAGTGKTRVITHRIAYLIRECDVPPWQIFATTFTNKAAEEMRRRVDALVPGVDAARITVGTFHSICVSILRREASFAGLPPRFTIADETDQTALIKDILKALDVPKSRILPKEVLARIGFAKIKMWTPAEAREQMEADWGEETIQAYEQYEERLAQSGAVDFDDLLLRVVRLFQENPDILAQYQDRWRYFLVDEYQDINKVQFELIRLLASRDHNLCVVGDEDQSIYSWRGAEVDNILEFASQFDDASTVRLEQNYRSTNTILEAANTVIAHNERRLGKRLFSDAGRGEPIVTVVGQTEREEAALVVDTIRRLRAIRGTAFGDIAIFYRVNALSRLFEDYLREMRIPYRVVGGIRFYDRAEIKDMLAYLRLVVNPADGLSMQRVINRPRRGIGDKTMTTLVAGAVKNRRSLWEEMQGAVAAKKLPKKALAGVLDLLTMMAKWREMAKDHKPLEILEAILRDTQYEASLGDPKSLETLSRIENLNELHNAVEQFQLENPEATLDDYIEKVALASAVDQLEEGDDCISLMTMHSAKGLEFPVVFVTGLEESIFPSPRSFEDPGKFEEERRLFYVGITRARRTLLLTRADARMLYGRTQYNPPSIFLQEVPAELTVPLGAALRRWMDGVDEDAPPPKRDSEGDDLDPEWGGKARPTEAGQPHGGWNPASRRPGGALGGPAPPPKMQSSHWTPDEHAEVPHDDEEDYHTAREAQDEEFADAYGDVADLPPAGAKPKAPRPGPPPAFRRRKPTGSRAPGSLRRSLEAAHTGANDMPEVEPKFPPGTRVKHNALGEGEVVGVRGAGMERKVKIRFDAGIEMEVLEQFGGLQLAEDLPF